MKNRIFASKWCDYELIDAGGGKKLERWGNTITIRPERLAYFKNEISFLNWRKQAHFEFIEEKKGKWIELKNKEVSWQITIPKILDNTSIIAHLELTKFKHLGIFPEQEVNWRYIEKHLKKNQTFLNLFAYTGIASLFAKSVQANSTHLDSVKQVISWANKNMISSNLNGIKWICEDALKFIEKNSRKKTKYDFIMMDPPAFGRGKKGEKWQLDKKLENLVKFTSLSLNPKGTLILNTYSPRININKTNSILEKHFSSYKTYQLCTKSRTNKILEHGLVSYCKL